MDELRFELRTRPRARRWLTVAFIGALSLFGLWQLGSVRTELVAARAELDERSAELERAKEEAEPVAVDEHSLDGLLDSARRGLVSAWRLELEADGPSARQAALAEAERARVELKRVLDARDALADGGAADLEPGRAVIDAAQVAHDQALDRLEAAQLASARLPWLLGAGGVGVLGALAFLAMVGRRRRVVVITQHWIAVDGRRIDVADLAGWRPEPSGVAGRIALRGGEELRVRCDDEGLLEELGQAISQRILTPDERIETARARLRAAELQAGVDRWQ